MFLSPPKTKTKWPCELPAANKAANLREAQPSKVHRLELLGVLLTCRRIDCTDLTGCF
jgi:hypothetical protein